MKPGEFAGPERFRAAAGRIEALLRRRAVRLALTVSLLAALVRGLDAGRLFAVLRGFDPVYGAAMLGVFLAALALFALRWWLIARALRIRATYGDVFRALWLAQFAGEIGPPLVVGELARFHGLRGRGDPWRRAASQALDRWSGQAVLWLLALLLLPFYLRQFGGSPLHRLAGFGLILLAALAVALVAVRRFLPLARSRARGILDVSSPLRSPLHYGLSLLLQVLLSANLALAAAGLGLAGHAPDVLLLGPLVLLGVGSLPSLVSDWGKREAAAVAVLAPAGLAPDEALAVGLVYGAAQLAAALPGGLWWGLLREMQPAEYAEDTG